MPGPISGFRPAVGLRGGTGARGAGGRLFKLTGFKELIQEFEQLSRDFPKALNIAAREELEKLLEDAKDMTPVDTGRLKSTGRILQLSTRKDSVRFDVVFGGIIAKGEGPRGGARFVDYALLIHENPFGYQYKVGEEQFLAKAADKHIPGIAERIADRAIKSIK